LVALIPLSWCGNILINSNFILRMIEWQNESSLFVVRIQGKQWYWAYKFNSDTNYRLQNLYINVGNNNWYKTSNVGQLNFNWNNSTLIFLYEYEFKKIHKQILEKKEKLFEDLLVNNYNTSFTPITYEQKKLLSNLSFLQNFIYYNQDLNFISNYKKIFNIQLQKILQFNLIEKNSSNYTFTSLWKNETLYSKYINIHKNNIKENNNLFKQTANTNYSFYEGDRMEEVEESLENLRIKFNNFPIKLIKGVLNKHNTNLLTTNLLLEKNILFSYRTNNDNIAEKISQVEQFWGFRQKKYKKLRSFFFNQTYKFNNRSYTPISNFINKENYSKYNLYNGVKNNKNKSEGIPATLARRLLRTKRTLVLPAHINITLITSSYDVVHSWFVPGLGLKIDCVPGRSTHHTLYIDNIGFYYGQCAEICGRYHHHMPIRVCALNYEHFLLWWQTKGLPRMYRSKSFYSNKSLLLNKFKY